MNSSFSFFNSLSINSIIIFSILICLFIIPINCVYSLQRKNNNNSEIDASNSEFFWPIPNYKKITSYYGKRTSPTARCFNISQRN